MFTLRPLISSAAMRSRLALPIWTRAFSSSLPKNSNVLEVDNPYSGEIVAKIPLKSIHDANEMVQSAAFAQQSWKNSTLEDRIALVNKFMEAFEKERDTYAEQISKQMGKPLQQAKGEINGMYERAKAMIKAAPEALADEMLPEKAGFYRKIAKEPVGVVLVIAPWNYPLLTAINTIVPAILAGNAVVIKHSPRTPLCADQLADSFNRAGAMAGIVQSLHCSHEVVNQLIANPLINFVAFTGSVAGGRAVYQSVASTRFIDATLELGGKDPAYVAEDANLSAAIDTLVDGALYNSGQSCCAIERVYVHHKHYQKFVDGALELFKTYKIGNPLDAATNLGPIAQAHHPKFLQSQVDEAKKFGAKVIFGGQAVHDAAGKGRFFQPTLLTECHHGMSIMTEESFGPVLPIQAVQSDEEAIKLMNDSRYGLTSCVFTNDHEKAMYFSKSLNSGTVFMNRCDYLDPELPWTGVKDTGKGVSLSKHGFRGVVRMKGYHHKFLPNA